MREDAHADPVNVDALPTDPLANAGDEVDSVEDYLVEFRFLAQLKVEAALAPGGDAQQERSDHSSGDRSMGENQEEAPLAGEGDGEREQSDPSSGDRSISEDDEEAPATGDNALQEEQCEPSSEDHPMTDATSTDPVDTMVTEETSIPSPAVVTSVIPFLAPPPTTQPEEIPQSTADPTRMNDEVVDDAMRDLDPMSPPPKDLVLCPQPLAVQEVIDLVSVHGDSNVDGGDSNRNDLDVNVSDNPVPQRGKGKARLRRSLDASFDVGAASAPPHTRSKGKEGPSWARKGREGTGRKDMVRPTLAGQKQSRGAGMKEQVRDHLERELAKKKNKEPPSQSALYLEAVRQAQEVVYKEYVASIPFTNNFEKNNVPDADV